MSTAEPSLSTPSADAPAPCRGASSGRRNPVVAALACLALALLAYAPAARRAEFLNFDDNFYFGPEAHVFRAASAAADEGNVFSGLAVLLDPTAVVADVWLPVAHVSLWLDARVFGADATWLHLTAALWHALAAFVLLRALLALRAPWSIAGPATLVFLLHPALCESVAWVSGRKDVLSGVLVFGAIWLAAARSERVRALDLAGVAVLTVLAMYAKATAVVLPLLLFVAVGVRGGGRRRWLLPLASFVAVIPAAWHHQHNAAMAGTMAAGSVVDRLAQVPGAFLHYGATALWPRGLDVLYPEVATLEGFRAAVVWQAPLLALVIAAIGFCARLPRVRAVAAGLAGFGLALLPFNTAWPASSIGVADRYLYLALPWLAVAVFAAMPPRPRLRLLVGGAIGLALLVATWLRAADFTNSQRLWRASLAEHPDSAVAALNLLQAGMQTAGGLALVDAAEGRALAERAAKVARYPEHERRAHLVLAQLAAAEGRTADAALEAAKALDATQRIVDSGRVRRDLGEALLVETLIASLQPLRAAGEFAAAERALDRARSLRPDDPRVASAEVLLDVERLAADHAAGKPFDDARAAALDERLERVREAGGDDAQVAYAQGTLARVGGKRLRAIACFRRAAQRDPLLADAWVSAAEVCLEVPSAAEAEEYARSGISIALQAGRAVDPRLRLCLARALQGQGRLDEAIGSLQDHCEQTAGRDRDANRLLSGLLMHKARMRLAQPDVTAEELERLCQRALRFRPDEPAVDLVRAKLLRDQRRFRESIDALERLQKALPDLEETQSWLAENLRDLGYERLFAKDDLGAAEAWLRFLAMPVEDVPQEAVRLQLQAIWRRQESAGIDARKRGDEAAARAAFRLCLSVEPDKHWAAWLLLSGLVEDAAADPDELDRLSRLALEGQQRHGLDRSRQVYARALVLRRLERSEDAARLVADYLASPDADAPADVLDALRAMR